MNPSGDHAVRGVTAGSLLVGALFGFAGGFLPKGVAQDSSWLVSSMGLVVGCLLLAHIHRSRPLAWAGFLLLAGAEMLIHAGGSRMVDAGASASFAAGLAFYVPALLVIASSRAMPMWLEIVTAVAAIPFAVHVVQRLLGQAVGSDNPAASIGYALLTIATLGWAWMTLRPAARIQTDRPVPA
jgi:hypothetical protein